MGIKKFTKDVVKEGKRVRWPKKDVLVPSIIVVIVVAALTGLLLMGEDALGKGLIDALMDAFKDKGKLWLMILNLKLPIVLPTSPKIKTSRRSGRKAWYVVNTYLLTKISQENLRRRVESMGLEDLIFRIIVAEQEVPVMKDGLPTDKTRMKNLYPGYVFVEMIMTDYAWYVVRNTPESLASSVLQAKVQNLSQFQENKSNQS